MVEAAGSENVDDNSQSDNSDQAEVKDGRVETRLAAQYSDTFSQKRADALVLMSEHFLSTMDEGLKPLSGGDKYQVVDSYHP